MRLDIAYRLHFRYAQPVSESQNEIRVRPRDDPRQQVLSYRLTTTPATRVLQTRDYFGTTVDHLGIRLPHDELLIVAEASVETVTSEVACEPVSCTRLADQDFVNNYNEYLAPSQHVQWGDLVDEVASWAVREAGDDVNERVLAVARAVPTVLAYQRGSTSIGVTLEELIDGGRGVCQDFAHLGVGMLRSIGIPARYVSGYLFARDETFVHRDADPHDSSSTVVSVQTHAWMEAAVPGHGWYALDPTNGGPISERHVVIGHGRDYNDVPPVRGVFNGTADAEVDAEVIIARPKAPVSMVTEPIRRQTRVTAHVSPNANIHQHEAQQQQQQ